MVCHLYDYFKLSLLLANCSINSSISYMWMVLNPEYILQRHDKWNYQVDNLMWVTH